MSSAKKSPPRFHVGDWVKFAYGPRKVSAKIVEDRRARGAVAYISGTCYGANADDARYADVQVLLEVAPDFDEFALEASPQLQREFAERARVLTDEVFLPRYPRARGEHKRGP
jgi:hypothetical protein